LDTKAAFLILLTASRMVSFPRSKSRASL